MTTQLTQSIDSRIQNLSYSSLLNLHSCPRKFQLNRLGSTTDHEDARKKESQSSADSADSAGGQVMLDDITPVNQEQLFSQNVTFAFGHVVGDGIQKVLEGLSEEEVIWQMFLGWHADLYAENAKQNKSIWAAITAIRRFISIRAQGVLKNWELLSVNGKPATELGFRITFPDGFKYRGFVDVVLRHSITNEIMVVELKTSSAANLNAAMYKNSAQGVGYSIVLDVIAPDVSAYKVLYLIYKTKEAEYVTMEFKKSYVQRALWIRELLLDIETIKLYENAEVYPMHGESCFSFFRECEYINLCTLSTANLITPPSDTITDVTYDVEVSLSDVIEAQLSKDI